jgi:glutamate--cysteine ligase catalytic subunit
MAPNEVPITLTTFPRLGTKDDYIQPYYPPSGPALRSQFVPDEIANPHIRFPTLAANIRSRRGRKVELNVPVFHDTNTPRPFKDPTVNYDLHNWPEDDDVRNGAAKDDHVYMDAMAFGMGSCCLQITFQAKNMTEGRRLYDQLSPLGPILLALTAATPIYKGFLVDTDVRWNQIGNAVDDRTREELGEAVSFPASYPWLTELTSCSLSRTTGGEFPSRDMPLIRLTYLRILASGRSTSIPI